MSLPVSVRGVEEPKLASAEKKICDDAASVVVHSIRVLVVRGVEVTAEIKGATVSMITEAVAAEE